jgi:hypothetical protein
MTTLKFNLASHVVIDRVYVLRVNRFSDDLLQRLPPSVLIQTIPMVAVAIRSGQIELDSDMYLFINTQQLEFGDYKRLETGTFRCLKLKIPKNGKYSLSVLSLADNIADAN